MSSPAHIRESSKTAERWRIYPGDPEVTWDGVAVVNTGFVTTGVTVSIHDRNGNELDSMVSGALEPNAKELFVLSSLFEVAPHTYFEVAADRPLAITALRGDLVSSSFLWENVAVPLKTTVPTDPVPSHGEVAETRDLPPFHGVYHRIVGDVILSQGSRQNVVLVGKQKFIDKVITKVIDGELSLTLPAHYRATDEFQVEIHITIPEIDKIDLAGIGQIRSRNQWHVRDLEMSLTGIGSIRVDLRGETITSTHAGIGEIQARGTARNHHITLAGVGTVKAFGLEVDDCEVLISSFGNVEVTVNNHLDVTILNFGSVWYKGRPIITQNTNKLGKVVDAN